MPEKKEKKKISSAKKRAKQAEKRRIRNKAVKTYIKTLTKRVIQAVEEKDVKNAEEALKAATIAIYKASSKGVIHKNTASRKVSRLAKKVNSITQETQEA